MARSRENRRRGKRIRIACVAALLVLVVIPFGVSAYLYESFFGTRYETSDTNRFDVEGFEGLCRTRYTFPSDGGQQLTGYLYYVDGADYRGMVVMAHGLGGGGHVSDMNVADYFAHHGYYAFAFDCTGNDESEGAGVGGLPQGIIDLDHAIGFAETLEQAQGLPVMLYGHSWGGYCVTNVLALHPEVRAVVSMAGFDRSSDLIEAQGQYLVGGAVHILMPYVRLYERLKFGSIAGSTATEAFASSDAAVMVVHDADDDTVPQRFGYDTWYESFGGNERFVFVQTVGRGHNHVMDSEEWIAYNEGFAAVFDDWMAALPYDRAEEGNWERFRADRMRFLEENGYLASRYDMLDTEMFREIVEFYDAS